MKDYINYMNASYMELYGQNLEVFRLDKTATDKHELYIEETTKGRIYIKPLQMRMLHDDMEWRGMLGTDIYKEEEGTMIFFVNFENMVQKITEARRSHIANLYIKYTGVGTPFVSKRNNKLTIYVGKAKYIECDLSERRFSTVRKLASYIHAYDDFTCELEGENDLSRNLVDFDKVGFSGRQILIYTEDTAYKNVTDVIEMGDAILTNKYRLYEVMSAAPAGEFGWEYVTWKLECKLASPENFNLPGNYIERIKRNEYGLRTKLDME